LQDVGGNEQEDNGERHRHTHDSHDTLAASYQHDGEQEEEQQGKDRPAPVVGVEEDFASGGIHAEQDTISRSVRQALEADR
jgi:hypothetical protein